MITENIISYVYYIIGSVNDVMETIIFILLVVGWLFNILRKFIIIRDGLREMYRIVPFFIIFTLIYVLILSRIVYYLFYNILGTTGGMAFIFDVITYFFCAFRGCYLVSHRTVRCPVCGKKKKVKAFCCSQIYKCKCGTKIYTSDGVVYKHKE